MDDETTTKTTTQLSLIETELIYAVADINQDFHQSQQEPPMSITGASHLSNSIKDMIAEAKARVADAHVKIGGAVDNLTSAANSAVGIANAINAEADDLLAAAGQYSNGGPPLNDPAPTPLPPMEPINPVPGPQLAPGTLMGTITEPKKNESAL